MNFIGFETTVLGGWGLSGNLEDCQHPSRGEHKVQDWPSDELIEE